MNHKELLALADSLEWKPASEAPTDGKTLLIKFPRMSNLVVRGWYKKVHDRWYSDRETNGGITKPEWFHDGDLYMEIPSDDTATKLREIAEYVKGLEKALIDVGAIAELPRRYTVRFSQTSTSKQGKE